MGDGIIELGESSRRNCADDMARLPDLINRTIRQRAEYRIVARDPAGTVHAVQDISRYCTQGSILSTYNYSTRTTSVCVCVYKIRTVT